MLRIVGGRAVRVRDDERCLMTDRTGRVTHVRLSDLTRELWAYAGVILAALPGLFVETLTADVLGLRLPGDNREHHLEVVRYSRGVVMLRWLAEGGMRQVEVTSFEQLASLLK